MKKDNKASRSCKKCKFYNLKERVCNSFNIDIKSTATGKYCKNYLEVRSTIPKQYEYKHINNKSKWNKYKTKQK